MEIKEGTASMDNNLRDLHNSSYDMRADFNLVIALLFIQNNSLFKNIAKTCSIDVKFIFDRLIVHV